MTEPITCPECGKGYWRCYIAGIPVSGHICQTDEKAEVSLALTFNHFKPDGRDL